MPTSRRGSRRGLAIAPINARYFAESLAHSLIGIDPEAQRPGADERHEIALPLPGRRLAQRRDQFIVGLRARRRTGTVLQRACDKDHGIARHRKLALAALAPEFEGGF